MQTEVAQSSNYSGAAVESETYQKRTCPRRSKHEKGSKLKGSRLQVSSSCSSRITGKKEEVSPSGGAAAAAAEEKLISNGTNYYNYKETGIKSRPVKLLKHPIEHIERKIILTYIIGFLFKLIAILSGPLIVLLAFLLVLPVIVVRRSIWLLLNLTCLCEARIRTSGASNSDEGPQAKWNYCPLSYLETFWFKESLVNTVILVIEDEQNARFSLERFKALVEGSILSKAAYRKFLSGVVAIGIPFYKSYFWHYLGLVTSIPVPEDITSSGEERDNHSAEWSGSIGSTLSQFSKTPSGSLANLVPGNGSESLKPQNVVHISMPFQEDDCRAESRVITLDENNDRRRRPERATDSRVYLADHIYIDSYFINCGQAHASQELSARQEKAKIRRYAYSLMEVNLDMTRPLWEIRVVPNGSGRRTYLIFRCHQSLADGHSLSAILTDHLSGGGGGSELASATETETDSSSSGADQQSSSIMGAAGARGGRHEGHGRALGGQAEAEPPGREEEEAECEGEGEEEEEELAEKRLRGLREKRSFVAKVSKSNSRESSVLVGPLTVLLWVIWTFTRRKDNHLNKCQRPALVCSSSLEAAHRSRREDLEGGRSEEPIQGRRANERSPKKNNNELHRRFYMTHYDLTKFHQIKQMTRSTVSDVILCALSGALRNYLRKFNGVSNPPTLNVSLTVNMRQEAPASKAEPSPPVGKQFDQTSSEAVVIEPSGRSTKATGGQKGPEVNCTLVNVPIPTSVEGTIPRLWELRTTMEELRSSADPWVMQGLQQFLFLLLPVRWYQWLINYIALRNSSVFVSNIRGPRNMVESWCVDLFQRALFEAQQPPRRIPGLSLEEPSKLAAGASLSQRAQELNTNEEQNNQLLRCRSKQDKRARNSSKLRLINKLGCLSAIYYCMQPPTSEIPISFNCITYHNKLFVTSLSRSLLVEDSKLLIKLFFAQLNQLANTIAKRKSFLAIIRTPTPIEISCEPASPVLDKSKNINDPDNAITLSSSSEDYSNEFDKRLEVDIEQIESSPSARSILASELDRTRRRLSKGLEPITILSGANSSSPVGEGSQFIKDDIETNLGSKTVRCLKCRQSACVCRRRKSLFSIDTSQRSANLLSLLHPNYLLARSNRSAENVETMNSLIGFQQQLASECLCGQQLLEELDEDMEQQDNNKATSTDGLTVSGNDLANYHSNEKKLSRESFLNGSRTPSDDGGRLNRNAKIRATCAKCRCNSARSLMSLCDHQQHLPQARQQNICWTNRRCHDHNIEASNLSLGEENSLAIGVTRGSDQLVNRSSSPRVSRCYSKSETDLLPMNTPNRTKLNPVKASTSKAASPTPNKESWFVIGRKGNRKISTIFPKRPFSSSFKTKRTPSPSADQPRSRNLIETSLDLISTRIPSRRRQSIATTTGFSSNTLKSIVVKDEINADVNLRYHLDGSILGIAARRRRFSTAGSGAVSTQRRSSLIPFGLMNNQALPKFLRDDGETHL